LLPWLNQWISGVLVPVVLMGSGIGFLCYLRGGPLVHLRTVFRVMTRRETVNGISPFRALTLALAGTLGVGNIVGVASAIAMGGAGAIFWMWVSALVAMILKYAEIVLAVKHRRVDVKGVSYGGAMYYIRDVFDQCRASRIGRMLAAVFALLCVMDALSTGCVIQVNAVAKAFEGVFDLPVWVCGVVLTVVCLFLVGRGVSSLSLLTERLVPLMTGGYLLLSAAVLILRAEAIPQALAGIFRDAFTPQSAVGGAFGFLLNRGVRYGTMRGLLSNEAGCGTAPIAHAASNTKSPVEQGFWGLFEVFVDTILLCTVTALVILVEPQVVEAFAGDGVMMTIAAYAAVLGQGAAWFLAVAVLLFGFATVICWSHYGAECIRYLTRRPAAQTVYHIAVCLSVLCGSLLAPDSLWDAADFAIGTMTLINLLVLILARREIQEETEIYFGYCRRQER
jgi:AGCS family alanine or glycine:cation symporter